MTKGLLKRTAAAAAALTLSVSVLSISAGAFGSLVSDPTPTKKTDAALLWATAAGDPSDWNNAPSQITLVGDEIVFVANGELRAIDKNTGKLLDKKAKLAASNGYGTVSPVYADGMVFVSESGAVQAFDAESFEPLWIYHDDLGGEPYSEIVYDDGYIYTGFYNATYDENWNAIPSAANFVCIPVEDKDTSKGDEEQAAAWKNKTSVGYYWAAPLVTDSEVIVANEADGGNSTLYFYDKQKSIEDGSAAIDKTISTISGNVRSGVVLDKNTNTIYFTSQGGKLYYAKLNADGTADELSSIDLGGPSTSTPVIAGGRLYIGVGYTANGSGIAVIDTESKSVAYFAPTNGYPQSSALVRSNGEDNYVYFTTNTMPSKVYVLHDTEGMTEPELETVTVEGEEKQECPVLFTPVGSHSQYCISSILSDENGTLYFKNDSNHIFAVGNVYDGTGIELNKPFFCEGETLRGHVSVSAYVIDDETGSVAFERDLTNTATYNMDLDEALKAGKHEIAASIFNGIYGDTEDETGYEYSNLFTSIEFDVLDKDSYDAVMAAIDAIEGIGEVTLESEEAINAARALYDALDDELKEYVWNYDDLEEAEKKLAELKEAQNQSLPDVTPTDDTSSQPLDSGTDSKPDGSGTSSGGSNSSQTTSSGAAKTSGDSNPATGAGTLAGLGAVLIAGAGVVKFRKKN